MRALMTCVLLIVPAGLVSGRDTDDWVDFTSKAGKFTVKMPSKPKEKTKEVETPAGTITTHVFGAPGDDGAYIVAYTDYPEEVIEGVLSHASHLGLPRDTPLKRALFACDELCGFIHACGLVRPTGIDGLEPKSVKKKLKQPSFAAGVHRDEVYAGAEGLGIELDEHIRNVVEALQPIAPELGLRTAESVEVN